MMYFDSVSEFLAMGGHGLYVWMVYGVTAASLACWLLWTRQRRSRVIRQIKQKIALIESGS